MRNFIYRLKSKYAKHPELLEEYGFNKYCVMNNNDDENHEDNKDDEDDEIFYAKGIKLPRECRIVTYLIGAFEKVYKYAPEEEKKDFEDYSFTKNGKLRLTKKVLDEFTKCQLCVVDRGLGKNCLFINAPDRQEYYNSKDLDECCGEIIERLIKEKVIYKKRNYAK